MSRVNPRLVYWIADLYGERKPALTAAHRDILACLATRHLDYSDGTGSCSVDKLAADTKTHRATVQRALAAGQKRGSLLQTSRGRRAGDGTVSASQWALIYPAMSTTQQCDIETVSMSQRPPSQRRTSATPTEKKQKTLSLTLDRAKNKLRDLGATEKEIEAIVTKLKADPHVRFVPKWLNTVLDSGAGPDLLAEIRQEVGCEDGAATVPWCGECSDPKFRQRFDAEDRPYRCGDCHPLAERAAS